MSVVNPLAKCIVCGGRATRLYQGNPMCLIHYSVYVKNPRPATSMVLPEFMSKAEPNY